MNQIPRDSTDDLDLPQALALLAEGRGLSRGQARAVFDRIMEGQATPAQIGALLMALRMKGETVAETAGAAESMRAHASPVRTSRKPLLDTCGTGGDGGGTWNISTAVALVSAGCGVAVAKHGNRSVSSRSGSADVLEALGVRLDLTPEEMGRCLDSTGLAFLFAPALHRAMRHAVAPRREMRLRTVFNLLGPLTNPAGAGRQLLGVYDGEKAGLMARALHLLGTEHAWVVHGLDGLDEISLAGPSLVFEVTPGGVAERRVHPSDAGLKEAPAEALRGGDPGENARWLDGLLRGQVRDSSRDMVVLNAAAALVAAEAAPDLAEGRLRAEESLDSGKALQALESLREFTQKVRHGHSG